MAARLPVPGDDVGQWGLILNAYLLVAHNEDGTLRDPIIDATTSVKGRVRLAGDLAGSADQPIVVSTSLSSPMPLEQGGTSSNTRTGALNALLPDQVSNADKLLKTDGTNASWIVATDITPDATAVTKGKVRLAGDFGGNATSPTVVSTSLTSALPINQGGTSSGTRIGALNALLPDQAANANTVLKSDGTNATWVPTTDITPDATTLIKGKVRLAGDLNGTSASPTVVSTSLSAPLPINQGGTSGNTPQAALNALLPTQTGNAGKIIQTDGTNTSWVPKPTNDDVLALMWMEVAA